jgi:hypothetical protein
MLRYWSAHYPCTSPHHHPRVVISLKYVYQKTFTGRARWGATFGGYANADGHGHGTHVAYV